MQPAPQLLHGRTWSPERMRGFWGAGQDAGPQERKEASPATVKWIGAILIRALDNSEVMSQSSQ